MGPNLNHSKCIRMTTIMPFILFFATTTGTSAYNVTYFLESHPNFSTFNQILTKTGIAKAIDDMKSTVTILALDNSAVSSISSQSQSIQRAMLATHVLLDYFDTDKLKEIKDNTPHSVINLYQKSGKTSGKEGTTNIIKSNDDFIFYSAVDDAPKNSKLVKEVGSRPFDVIVLQINTAIIVPGLDSASIALSPSSPPPPPKSSTSPTSSTLAPSPNLSPEEAPADDKPTNKKTSNNGERRNMVNVGLVFTVIIGFLTLNL